MAIEYFVWEMMIFFFDWKICYWDGVIKWVNGKGFFKRLLDGSIVWNIIIMDIIFLKNVQ